MQLLTHVKQTSNILQVYANYQITLLVCENQLRSHGKCTAHPLATPSSIPMGPIPSFIDPMTGFPLIDPLEPLFCHVALKVLFVGYVHTLISLILRRLEDLC